MLQIFLQIGRFTLDQIDGFGSTRINEKPSHPIAFWVAVKGHLFRAVPGETQCASAWAMTSIAWYRDEN